MTPGKNVREKREKSNSEERPWVDTWRAGKCRVKGFP